MKILFIRSLQVELLNAFIERFIKNNKHENIELCVLDNKKQMNNLSKFFTKVYTTKNLGDFTIFNISLRTLKNLNKEKIDYVVMPSKQNNHHGLENILFLISFIKCKKIFHLQYDHNYFSFDHMKELRKSIILKHFFKLIVTLILIIPMFIISLIISLFLYIIKKS